MYGANMKSGAVWATIITLTALLMFTFDTCEAKRGCQAFGHSCYGGHGKRVDSRFGSAPEEVSYGSNQQAGLNDMVFTAPRSLPNTGPLENQEDTQVRQNMPQDLYNLSPFLRQWLQAYRNSQDFRSNNM
ncbi:CCHamide-2 [Carabus blaptoides fortunei]